MSRFWRRLLAKTTAPFYFAQGGYEALRLVVTGSDERIKKSMQTINDLRSQMLNTDRDIVYSNIGQALTAWSSLEETLVAMVAVLLRIKIARAGLIMYSILNFAIWLQIIGALFDTDDDLRRYKRKWNKISERIRQIKDVRDQLAHQSVIDDNKGITPSAKLRASEFDTRPKSLAQKPLGLDDIRSFTEKVTRLAKDTLALLETMSDSLESSPEKSAA